MYVLDKGVSGSPLIKRYNNNLIIGIHYGSEKSDKGNLYNLATPVDIIKNDIKYQLSKNNKNKINLIYEKKDEQIYKFFEDPNIIFGSEFVKNNKDNIKLIINGRENKLIEKYDLKKRNE